jgi:hypothetical protein
MAWQTTGRMSESSAVTRLQGVYYVATGLWSLVHYRSFEAISGRKHDRWLVRTVGLLAVAVGIGLVRHPGSRPGGELADTSAASFAIADLLAVSSGQGRVYLADAAIEWLLIAARHFGARRWSPFASRARSQPGKERTASALHAGR